MKTNWQKIKISNTDYFSIQLGGTPATGVAEYWNGDILWVTPIDLSKIDQAVINETIRNITESGSKNSSAKLLPKGSIVISTRAPIGYLGIAGRELAINQGCKALIIKKSDKTDSKFLYFLLLSKIKLIKSLGTGSTFLELSKSELGSIELNFPPKPTQQKIVKVLDTIQVEVGKQKEIIEKTKELKRSLMKKLFSEGTRGEKLKETEIGKMPMSWVIKPLKDFILKIKQNNPWKNSEKEIKYIDVSSISNETFKIVNYKEFSGKDAPSRARKIVMSGDIIFATIRPSLKRIALVGDKFDKEYCSTAFCVIRCDKNKLHNKFIFQYIVDDNFIDSVSGSQRGTGYPAISDSDVYNQLVPVPKDIEEQHEIASILQKVDERIESAQKQKGLYEELFHTTLNKLMTGKIVFSPVIPAKAGIQD